AVDFLFQPGDLGIGHCQPGTARAFFGQAQISFDVKKIVLNSAKGSVERLVARCMQAYQSDDGVDLIDSAIGGDPQVILLAPGARPEGRRPIVTGPRIDTVEYNHVRLAYAFSLPRIRGNLILSGFGLKRWGDTHAYSNDCDCCRISGVAGRRASTSMR